MKDYVSTYYIYILLHLIRKKTYFEERKSHFVVKQSK